MTRAPRGALVDWQSACLRLAVDGPGRASTVLALPEPIALAVHLGDVDVMGEAVEEGTGQALGPNTLVHSSNGRLLVTMTEPRS